MERNLKFYVVEYQKGNTDILNQLIGFKKVREINKGNLTDLVDRLKFADKGLNKAYLDVCKLLHHINWKDIDHYVLQALWREKNGEIKSIFDNVDVTKSPSEILVFVSKKLEGFIKNKIKDEEMKYYDHTKPNEVKNSNQNGEDDEGQENNISLYDSVVYQEFNEMESSVGYKEFLEFVGGIEKILNPSQLKIYRLLQDQKKTKKAIAKEHGTSAPNITKQFKTISRKIRAKWIYYKSVRALVESGLYETIKRFLTEYDNIIEFDTKDSFDYFGYIIKFLKDNYKKGEQDTTFTVDSFKHIHKKEITLHNTVFDLLADEVTRKTYTNLYDILEESISIEEFDAYEMGKREKNTIRNQVLKVFRKYVQECEKSIEKVCELIAHQKKIDSNNLLKKIS